MKWGRLGKQADTPHKSAACSWTVECEVEGGRKTHSDRS